MREREREREKERDRREKGRRTKVFREKEEMKEGRKERHGAF